MGCNLYRGVYQRVTIQWKNNGCINHFQYIYVTTRCFYYGLTPDLLRYYHCWLLYVTFVLMDGKWLCLSFSFPYLVIVGRGRAGRDTPRSLRSDVERDRVRLHYVLPESPASAWCAVWVYTAPDSQTTRSIHSPHRIRLKHTHIVDVEAKAMISTNVISSSNRKKCHIIHLIIFTSVFRDHFPPSLWNFKHRFFCCCCCCCAFKASLHVKWGLVSPV